MSVRVTPEEGVSYVVLPSGWSLRYGETLVIPDEEWEVIAADETLVAKIAYVEVTADPEAGAPPIWADIQRAAHVVKTGVLSVVSLVTSGNVSAGNNVSADNDVDAARDIDAGRNITAVGTVRGDKLYAESQTGATVANAQIGVSGQVIRDTSSRRYKYDVTRHHFDPHRVLSLQGVLYRRKDEWVDGAPDPAFYPGLIAEEVHDLGLTELVVYDDQNRPDGVRYDRLVVALLDVVKDLRNEVDDLRYGG